MVLYHFYSHTTVKNNIQIKGQTKSHNRIADPSSLCTEKYEEWQQCKKSGNTNSFYLKAYFLHLQFLTSNQCLDKEL